MVEFIAVLVPFYSHVNYSVTKIACLERGDDYEFYSHVNYSVTKISLEQGNA